MRLLIIFSRFLCLYVQAVPPVSNCRRWRCSNRTAFFGLCTITVYLELFVYKSTILLFAPPTCNAHTITILLDDYCAIYDAPPTPPLYAIHTTILAMALSYKGQRVLELKRTDISPRADSTNAIYASSCSGWGR